MKRKGGEGLVNKSLMGKMKEKLNLKAKEKSEENKMILVQRKYF